jgi:hypothetical protein
MRAEDVAHHKEAEEVIDITPQILKIPSKSTLRAINDIKNKKNLKYFDTAEDMKKALGLG